MDKRNLVLIAEAELAIDPANLRRHPVRNLAAIKASLQRFGFQKPLVIDAKNTVIAGNGTLMAARELGLRHVPCLRSSLKGAERVAYAIADNRAAELAEWDNGALLETLQAMNPDEVEELGFEPGDLSNLVDEQLGELEEDPAVVPAQIAVTKPGDLWHLGEHRLVCGDSTKPKTYEKLLGGQLAALCSTDPPYMVDYTGVRGRHGKDWSNVYNEIDIKDTGKFYRDLWTCILGVTAPNAAFYCWHADKRTAELRAVWESLDMLPHQIVVWVKPAAVMTRSIWLYRHEAALMGWRRGHMPHRRETAEMSAVWEHGKPLEQYKHEELVAMIKDASDIWEVNWEGKARVVDNEHPTQKPLEIFARPMRKHTNVGDVVLEPFSGSGSQLIAAEQVSRRCHAIELEPVFVDVAVRRWQRLTGKDATLVGKSPWRTVAKQRGVTLDEEGTPIAGRVRPAKQV